MIQNLVVNAILINFKVDRTKLSFSKISEALFRPLEIIFIHFCPKFPLVTNQIPNLSVAID
jgi:hypothetical protein